jgi:hypothetical protein
MRGILICHALLLGSTVALAQEPSLQDAQKQSFPAQQQAPAHNSPANTTPPPPLSQPQAPIADQAAPAAVGPAQANTTSASGGPAVLGATPQTMPSTISEANAALDKIPITALQFPLTDEQKQLIVKSVLEAPKAQTNTNLADTHVAMFLPTNVQARAFASDVIQKLPDAGRYKYVRLDDRILIIDPTVLTVVGEIRL